jgi:hypothetical protein
MLRTACTYTRVLAIHGHWGAVACEALGVPSALISLSSGWSRAAVSSYSRFSHRHVLSSACGRAEPIPGQRRLSRTSDSVPCAGRQGGQVKNGRQTLTAMMDWWAAGIAEVLACNTRRIATWLPSGIRRRPRTQVPCRAVQRRLRECSCVFSSQRMPESYYR